MELVSKEFSRLYSLLLEQEDTDVNRKRILNYRSAERAYHYAKNVIKGRWPEAEDIIKKDAEYAYFYASDVIEGRWPEAEELIKKNEHLAFLYAKNVIKGRWREAEEIIKQNCSSNNSIKAFWYAKDIIKGRWPEVEEYIKKTSEWHWDEYKSFICKQCNGEGVIDLGIGGAEDECQTCFGKGFDPKKLQEWDRQEWIQD